MSGSTMMGPQPRAVSMNVCATRCSWTSRWIGTGSPVEDVYPQRIPDLFGAKPVILTGRYTGASRGMIRLRGKMSGREFVREIAVDLPEAESRHHVLSSLWAHSRIDDLMSRDFHGIEQREMKPELRRP
ncbi:MAG: hypothetical protein ABR501_09360 [Pyrinomonadaceae bacterium]